MVEKLGDDKLKGDVKEFHSIYSQKGFQWLTGKSV